MRRISITLICIKKSFIALGATIFMSTKTVPCQFKLQTSLPNLRIEIARNKLIRDEEDMIYRNVASLIRQKMKTKSNLEIELMTNENIKCEDNFLTDNIDYISINFVGY